MANDGRLIMAATSASRDTDLDRTCHQPPACGPCNTGTLPFHHGWCTCAHSHHCWFYKDQCLQNMHTNILCEHNHEQYILAKGKYIKKPKDIYKAGEWWASLSVGAALTHVHVPTYTTLFAGLKRFLGSDLSDDFGAVEQAWRHSLICPKSIYFVLMHK